MATNQLENETQLEKRFPDFRTKAIVEFEGLPAFVFSHDHTVQKYPCYNYGYQIGDDISHTFHTLLLIVPAQGVKRDQGGFVIIRINGYSSYSERYDQDSVSVSCEMSKGERMDLESRYYYQKYGGQSRNTKNPLAPLLNYLRSLGYTELGEQQLANWVSKMRSRFSY